MIDQNDLEIGFLAGGILFSLLYIVTVTMGRQQAFAANEMEMNKSAWLSLASVCCAQMQSRSLR